MFNKSNWIHVSLILAAIMPVSSANAVTLIAYPDGSGEYSSIQMTVNAANDGDTVLLADGTFRGRGNHDIHFLGKEIVLGSLSGNVPDCIIDIEGEENSIAERGFIFDNNENANSILQNITIIHGSADAPCPECEGGGVYIYYSSPIIRNVIFRDNYAATGAAISCTGASPLIEDCLIIGNRAFEGAVAGLDSSEITLRNCLISDNVMDLRGGGVTVQNYCTVNIANCTITNNYAILGAGLSAWNARYIINNSIISFNGGGASISDNEDSDFQFTYSDIFGNTEGDWIDSISGQLGVNGNINQNPLYVDTVTSCYYLQTGSPCINTADPSSPLDPDGSRADMGAFCYDETGIKADNTPLPNQTRLIQNYPNPFNPSTTIEFYLESPAHVNLTVFDILGRQVVTLLDENKSAGTYRAEFDASGLAGGLYFYRLSCGNYNLIKTGTVIK
jgi:hypothetical protein